MSETATTPVAEAGRATLSPVKIATMVDASKELGVPQDELVAGNRAAVQTINETQNGLGGSGHPIELDVFETGLDPERTLTLAKEIAADPSYVAIVGHLVTNEVTPVFESALLPSLPSVACTKREYYSPLVFSSNGGHHVMCAGPVASALSEVGNARRLRSFSTTLSGMSWYGAVNNLILERFGLSEEDYGDAVIIPWAVDDIAPYVAAAAKDVDAVHCSLAGEGHLVATIRARHALGISTPFVFQGMAVYRGMLDDLGEAADGVLIASYFPTADSDLPGEQAYLASMHAAGCDHFVGDKSQMGWMAFDLLNYATRGLDSFDRASVLGALRGVTDYTAGGITPPLDFSRPGPGIGYPRIHNWTYYPQQVVGGRLVPAGDGSFVELPNDIVDVDVDF